MSAQIIELFPGDHTRRDVEARRRRMWVDLAQPLIVAPGVTLELITLREDERERLQAVIRSRGRAEQGPDVFEIERDTYLDMSAFASLMLLPRAVRYTATGRIDAVLCDFVLIDRDRRFVH